MSSQALSILIVEDAPMLGDRLSVRDDLRVAVVASYGDIIKAAERASAEILLIGASVPFARASEICGEVKRDPRTACVPILLFGRREQRDEEVNAFNAGADDYLGGSPTTSALIARLEALVRRSRTASAAGTSVTPRDHAIHIGQLKVEPDSYCVKVGDRFVDLGGGEFQLLWKLAVHRGATVSNEQLARIGPNGADVTTMKTVRAHVSSLRHKLGTAGHQLKTVRGVGYRLVAE